MPGTQENQGQSNDIWGLISRLQDIQAKATLQKLNRLRKKVQIPSPSILSAPMDAVAQTVRVSNPNLGNENLGLKGTLAYEEKLRLEREQEELAKELAKAVIRGQLTLELAPGIPYVDEEAVEREYLRQYGSPYKAEISMPAPEFGLSREGRRAIGWYTPEDRELAAKMNDMRSQYFLNFMPNFGREYAWYHPELELDAVRASGSMLGNGLIEGLGIGLGSSLSSFGGGFARGWNAAGNLATKVGNGFRYGARMAAPIVKNPRWIASNALVWGPALSAYADGNSGAGGGGFNWFIPAVALGIGLGAKPMFRGIKKMWSKGSETAAQNLAKNFTYKADRRFFTWEKPGSWEKRYKNKLYSEDLANEWNSVATDPAKQQEFIKKYNIRSTKGSPIMEPVLELATLKIPSTREVPLTRYLPEYTEVDVLGPDGTVRKSKQPLYDANGEPVLSDVKEFMYDENGNQLFRTERVVDSRGRQLYTTEKLFDKDGKPQMVTVMRPKLDDKGKKMYEYPYIQPNKVPEYIRNPYSTLYTSTFDPNLIIFKGPTTWQKGQAYLRNTGRALGAAGIVGGVGYNAYNWIWGNGSSSGGNTLNNSTEVNTNPTTQTDTTMILLQDGSYARRNNSGLLEIIPVGVDSKTNLVVLPDTLQTLIPASNL